MNNLDVKDIPGFLKADILVDSLKYFKKFNGKIVVIKYGGNAMIDEKLKDSVVRDIVLLKYVGMRPVIVHGGGPEITELQKLKGIEAEFVNGLRVTTKEVMKCAEMALTGSVGPDIASRFNANDVLAVSISGKDGKTVRATQRDERLGLVGEVSEIDPTLILKLLDSGYLPVVSPVAYGEGGKSLNINSDEVAKKLSAALKADKLIMITDVDGVLKDPKDSSSKIDEMDLKTVAKAIEDGIISGGMIPKLDCCTGAIEGGVNRCHIINGTIPHSLILELFTRHGVGTLITKDLSEEGEEDEIR